MTGGWEETTIGALIERFGGEIKTGPFGTTLKASEYSSQGVPLISVGEIQLGRIELHTRTPRVDAAVTNRLPEYLLRPGDIVFGRKGAVERSALVTADQDGWFLGSDGIRLRLGAGCNPNFISYCLLTRDHKEWIQQHATGTTMASLNQRIIESIPIRLPPLKVQNAIASMLSVLDRRIENNQLLSQTLEHLAQTLFKSWFVDFDPVVAKSEGRKPFGMSDEIAALFPDSFEESELGAVPKGWRVVDIGHLTDIQNGFAFKSDWWKPQGTPVVKIGSVKPGYVDVADASFLDSQKAAEFRAYELEEGDILIGLTGYPGEVGLVPRSIPKPLLNQRVGRFTPKKANYRSFVYAMTRRSEFREQVEQRAHGTAQLNVSTSGILSIKCTVPTEELLEVFHRLMNPMITKILRCFDETSQLSKTRDALLPELLEGRIFEASLVAEPTAA